MNCTPLADGQTGVLGDGVSVHVEPAGADDDVDVDPVADDAEPAEVAELVADDEDAEAVPTLIAAAREGFELVANVAVPDFK